MDINELRRAYSEKLATAQALAANWQGKEADMPQDVADQINTLLGETDGIKARIEMGQQLQGHQDFLDAPVGTKAAHLGWRETGPGEGDMPVDEKAWREVEVKTPTGPKVVRYNVPLAVQQPGYKDAFEAYCRRGFDQLGPEDRKTLTVGLDSAGGFTVPEDYQVELIKKVATVATVRANARVVQTSRDSAKWPKVAYTTDDKYTSGVRMTWTGESPSTSTAHRVTDPVFGLYTIPVHTAMASMPLSNDLLEDSAFDIAGIAADLMGEAFGLGENDAFWNGTGINRPMGILTQVDAGGPASVALGATDAPTANGIIDLAYALPSQYEANAKWYMAKATEKTIRKLRTDGTSGDFLWPIVTVVGNLGAVQDMLLGSPALRDEFVPAIDTNAYSIVYGDLKGYIVLDRVGMSVARLSEIYAETNITMLLARRRVGGQLVEPWRVKAGKMSAS